jgi:flagellar basal-body rod protein FlgB
VPNPPIVGSEHGSLIARPRIGLFHSHAQRQAVVFDSVTSVALSSALDGLALRQRVIANNIANVNTPNYHAKRVTFEDALAKSVGEGNGRAAAATQLSLEPTQLNGNNVNLDTETLSNVDTVLRFQFAAQAAGSEFTAVRTAMRTN